MSVADILNEKRGVMSQKDFAKKLKISSSYLNDLLNGRREIGLHRAVILGKALGDNAEMALVFEVMNRLLKESKSKYKIKIQSVDRVMTTKDGLDFEAIAKKLIMDIHFCNEESTVKCAGIKYHMECIFEALQQAYAKGLKNNTQELIAVCECEHTREVDADGNQIVVQCNYHKEMGEYYTRGYNEGLKKSVVAKVPLFASLWKKFVTKNEYERGELEGAKQLYTEVLSQIKAVELKMPERRKYRCVQDNNELYGREDIAHDNGTVEGWNAHDDAIIRMNPELFGEIKK